MNLFIFSWDIYLFIYQCIHWFTFSRDVYTTRLHYFLIYVQVRSTRNGKRKGDFSSPLGLLCKSIAFCNSPVSSNRGQTVGLNLKFVFLGMSSECTLKTNCPVKNSPKELLLFSYVTGFLVGFHIIICTS